MMGDWQWVGNLATIAEWREICLQEGLTTFLDYVLSASLRLNSTTTEVRCAPFLASSPARTAMEQ